LVKLAKSLFKYRWVSSWTKLNFLLLGLGLLGSCTDSSTIGGNTNTAKISRLDTVLQRGKLICGVSGEVPGFSFVDQGGKYSGLDVDFCRSIASALFDDPEKVEYRNLNAKERFTAVQTGEVDVLSRNTTWTIGRDTSTALEFAPTTFYDGQGMMVRKDSKIKNLEGLNNASICTQSGTTTELNLADQMRKLNIPYKPVTFEDVNAAFAAYQSGRCTAISADRSALVSRRTLLSNAADHVVLDTVFSKEPLSPAVSNGDSKWFDAVKWIIYSTMAAEELGIDSKNVAQMASSPSSEVKRFLGTEGELGKNMGLSPDFAARVVKHVGNYGEIYNRNLGPGTKFNLARGLNNLWTQGGLIYSPPFR